MILLLSFLGIDSVTEREILLLLRKSDSRHALILHDLPRVARSVSIAKRFRLRLPSPTRFEDDFTRSSCLRYETNPRILSCHSACLGRCDATTTTRSFARFPIRLIAYELTLCDCLPLLGVHKICIGHRLYQQQHEFPPAACKTLAHSYNPTQDYKRRTPRPPRRRTRDCNYDDIVSLVCNMYIYVCKLKTPIKYFQTRY